MKILVGVGKGLLFFVKIIPAFIDWLSSESKGKHVAKKAGGRVAMRRVGRGLKRFGI